MKYTKFPKARGLLFNVVKINDNENYSCFIVSILPRIAFKCNLSLYKKLRSSFHHFFAYFFP